MARLWDTDLWDVGLWDTGLWYTGDVIPEPPPVDVVYAIWWVDRRGERHAFNSKELLINRLDANPANIIIEASDKVYGYSGYIYTAPDGDYAIQGPNFKDRWTGILTVDRTAVNPFVVV